MKLDGHAKLTNAAIEKFVKYSSTDPKLRKLLLNLPSISTTYKASEFSDATKSNSQDNTDLVYDNIVNQLLPGMYSGFPLKGRVVRHVVGVDFDAAYVWGHRSNYGQRYHFLRAEHETTQSSHINACYYIKMNTGYWVSHTLRMLSNKYTVINPTIQSKASQYLALAIHSLQDSFSTGHTRREDASGPFNPGDIREMYIYGNQNKGDHSSKDYLTGDINSIQGQLAINATVDLLKLCTEAVLMHYYILRNWDGFTNKWLKLRN